MKIRNGYVSNSSSSSYIIEVENMDKFVVVAGETMTIDNFLLLIEQMKDYDTDIEIRDNNQELIEYINNSIEWVDDENKEKLIELKNDIEESGKEGPYFIKLSISNNISGLHFIFNLMKKYELFKIRFYMEE